MEEKETPSTPGDPEQSRVGTFFTAALLGLGKLVIGMALPILLVIILAFVAQRIIGGH
jgi:hypothetical protein